MSRSASTNCFLKVVRLIAHALRLLPVLLLTLAVYWIPSNYYYCGFDDIRELHRLRATATPGLSNDFTTPLVGGGGQKYRPLSWTANRLTWSLGQGSPRWFRFRNLACHGIAIAAIYGIAWFLFHSFTTAALAALLFSIHPYTHQGLMGAVWTVTPSAACLLLGVFFFLYAFESHRARLPLLAASVLFGGAGFFFYDPMAAYFGIIAVYAGMCWWRGWHPRLTLFQCLLVAVGCVAIVFLYIDLRQTATAGSGSLTKMLASPKEILVNLCVYFGSPALLIDPVLGNELLDLPLPSALLRGRISALWLAVTLLPLAWIGLQLFIFRKTVRERFGNLDFYRLFFLVIVMGGVQAPFLLFSGHASETYMYPLMAFLSIFAAVVLTTLVTGRMLAMTAVLLALLYIPALAVRSSRICQCSQCVSSVAGLFEANRSGPVREFLFSHVPGLPVSEVYGFYGYRGIDSVGMGDYGGIAVQELANYFYAPRPVDARVVSPEELHLSCDLRSDRKCFYVYPNGELEAFVINRRIP